MNSLVNTTKIVMEPAGDLLAAGTMAGPWIVERELGRGGMGRVYAVVHEEIGKRAALKVIHRHLCALPQIEQVQAEARIVNLIGQANIVDIFETGRLADGRPYIVMERLDGQSLAELVEHTKLLSDTVIDILLQITDALIAAHAAGVIHRDLKPENVFLVDGARVKVLDWGIATTIGACDGVIAGTPTCLAPEQACGDTVTDKTDIYALGVLAFSLFLEQLPFEAETAGELMTMHIASAPPLPRDLWPDIPRALEDLLLAMLAKQPEDRPGAFMVAIQLRAVRDEVEARKRSAAVELPPFVRARRPLWGYAVGAFALAAATAAFFMGRPAPDVIAAHASKPSHVEATPPASRVEVAPAVAPPQVSEPRVEAARPAVAARVEAALGTSEPRVEATPPAVASIPTAVAPPHRRRPARISPPVAAVRGRVVPPAVPSPSPVMSASVVPATLDPDVILEPYQ